jgi:hypothetical protein
MSGVVKSKSYKHFGFIVISLFQARSMFCKIADAIYLPQKSYLQSVRTTNDLKSTYRFQAEEF